MCAGILTRNNHNKKEIVREKGARGKKRRGGREYKGGKWTRDKVCVGGGGEKEGVKERGGRSGGGGRGRRRGRRERKWIGRDREKEKRRIR